MSLDLDSWLDKTRPTHMKTSPLILGNVFTTDQTIN